MPIIKNDRTASRPSWGREIAFGFWKDSYQECEGRRCAQRALRAAGYSKQALIVRPYYAVGYYKATTYDGRTVAYAYVVTGNGNAQVFLCIPKSLNGQNQYTSCVLTRNSERVRIYKATGWSTVSRGPGLFRELLEQVA